MPAVDSFFLDDLISLEKLKSGMMEFFVASVFEKLHQSGVKRVRMGLVPLARLPKNEKYTRALNVVRRLGSSVYSSFSQERFKAQFNPTAWDVQYLVFSKPITVRTWVTAFQVHFPKLKLSEVLSKQLAKVLTGVAERVIAKIQPQFITSLKPLNEFLKRAALKVISPVELVQHFLRSAPITFGLVTVCLSFHLLRLNLSSIDSLFLNSGFTTEKISFLGLMIGPFFHNTTYHLLGDLLTIVVAGILAEVLVSSRVVAAVSALGLWVSNPLTALLLVPVIRSVSSAELIRLNSIVDYGSSNASYALAAFAAMSLKKPAWVILPFFVNATVYSFLAQNWLGTHHYVALVFGAVLGKWAFSRKLVSKD